MNFEQKMDKVAIKNLIEIYNSYITNWMLDKDVKEVIKNYLSNK